MMRPSGQLGHHVQWAHAPQMVVYDILRFMRLCKSIDNAEVR